MNCKKEQVWQVRPGRLYLIVFLQNGKTRCNGLTDPNIDWKHYAKLFFAHQDLNNVIRVSRGLRPKLHNLEVRLNGPVFWFKLTQTLYRIWHPFQIPCQFTRGKGKARKDKWHKCCSLPRCSALVRSSWFIPLTGMAPSSTWSSGTSQSASHPLKNQSHWNKPHTIII